MEPEQIRNIMDSMIKKMYDMELAVPESISARTLADMDRTVSNFKKGDVSPAIDLSDL